MFSMFDSEFKKANPGSHWDPTQVSKTGCPRLAATHLSRDINSKQSLPDATLR